MREVIKLVQICLLLLPSLVNAQFTFTTNTDDTLNVASFSGSGAVTIPSITNGLQVTSIGNNAFQNNASLTSIMIPDSVAIVGDWAFQHCSGLTNLSMGKGLTNIGNYAFIGCSGLPSITIPDSVTSIGNLAFNSCNSVTNFTIPDSVISVGSGAFDECAALPSATIPDSVTYISAGMFGDDLNLTNIIIPHSVTNIGDYAFQSDSLVSLTIPNSVTSIGAHAFQGCNNLVSLTVPASVTNFGDQAIGSCAELAGIYFQGNAPAADPDAFSGDGFFPPFGIVYYLPNTTGWSSPFGGLPAVLWNPTIQTANPTFGIQNNDFGFSVVGTTNIPVVVEACSNLASPMWTPLLNGILTNGSIYFSDSQWTNYPARFYRIRSP